MMENRRYLLLITLVGYVCVHQSVAQSLRNGMACRTPNGIIATCKSILRCTHFITAIRGGDQSQIAFIRKSQCGWDEHALVCCGDQVDYINDFPEKPIERRLLTTHNGNANFHRNPAIPERTHCGFQESDRGLTGFVVGGSEAEINEFPWMALLGYVDDLGNRKWSCGGTLINSRYVLTAGHCVTGEVLNQVGSLAFVKLGEHDTRTEIDCDKNHKCNSKPIILRVQEVKYHPGYDLSSNSPNDIALIRLERKVNYSEFVRPICLAEPHEFSNDGENMTTAGWGKKENGRASPTLFKVDIPFVDHVRCERTYLSQGVELVTSQICAGGEGGKDSCAGDSGGPLMKRTSSLSQWYQEGVVSFGSIKCGIKGLPGVYTKVADFLPWIHNTVRD